MGTLNQNLFLSTFGVSSETTTVNSDGLSRHVWSTYHVEVPASLRQFWRDAGVGYFGDREMLFFGGDESVRSVVAWNEEPFWQQLQPPPVEGGSVFFAENPFGEQLGFRWINGECQIVLFIVDTMELFLVCEESALFREVLIDKAAITDVDRLHRVRAALGVQPPNTHYAPIVSPLVGGSDDERNFQIEPPFVHFVTAIETWRSVSDLPVGTRIAGFDVDWENN